jgi:hypothetical protein
MGDLGRDYNHSRFDPAGAGGFYESWFQRANHPTRPLAFWIRCTVFSPKGRPRDAIGELWAVWFDGESGRHVVAKSELPIAQCALSREALDVRIGAARLQPGHLRGMAERGEHRIEWDLAWDGGGAPLFLLPPALYDRGLPKAKSLVGAPLARFSGSLVVDGVRMAIDRWTGSQNHNWGAKHTDRYAWGQVAGFDNAPDSFLEVATGQLKIGPWWTPRLTPLVLRHEGEEYALRSIGQALRARGRFGPRPAEGRPSSDFHWDFATHGDGIAIEGSISAPKEAFVGLRYYNPPGGEKWCLNSKLAACRLRVSRAGKPDQTLEARDRAAFEILTDDRAHGVEIST